MGKDRFSVSMDDDLVKWLDMMVDEKIFSSRSHALEFCVKQLSNFGIENIIMLNYGDGRKEPIFLPSQAFEKIEYIMQKLKLKSADEALSYIINTSWEVRQKEENKQF